MGNARDMSTRQSPRLAARRAAKETDNGTVTKPSLKLDTDDSRGSTEKTDRKPNIAKLYVRGCISNGLGLLILYGCARGLGVENHVYISAGIQLAVFLLHGLPFSSERFYDLSGSFTHFSLVAYSLAASPRVRTPRQVLLALFSVVWMTRLGTFLFARIQKDGKDERFDKLKACWLSFLGAWTLQACWVTLIQLPVILLNNRDDPSPLGSVDAVSLVLWVVGFLFEFTADIEKATFRADPANKSRFITTGAWALSRHPNYFGEIVIGRQWPSASRGKAASTAIPFSTGLGPHRPLPPCCSSRCRGCRWSRKRGWKSGVPTPSTPTTWSIPPASSRGSQPSPAASDQRKRAENQMWQLLAGFRGSQRRRQRSFSSPG